MPINKIINKYEECKKAFSLSCQSNCLTSIFEELFELTYGYLKTCTKMPLKSLVAGKEYFSFKNDAKFSRSINSQLFCDNKLLIDEFFKNALNNTIPNQSAHDITVACYTIAISFCATIDLLKKGDQKTPGTYFEYFIGHLYGKHFGLEPQNQLEVLNLDMKSKLPTDLIFDYGDKKPKFHIPVKTSTRERVVQVWAHQRVLDGVYGTGRFLGLLSCLSETKLDHKKLEVVEICLPDQWRIYQLFIAQLQRIYYLDIPNRYAELNNVYPKIHVKEFGEFFHELTDLTS